MDLLKALMPFHGKKHSVKFPVRIALFMMSDPMCRYWRFKDRSKRRKTETKSPQMRVCEKKDDLLFTFCIREFSILNWI